MILSRWIDNTIATFAPAWAVRRANARRVLRGYQGAETNRLTGNKPSNRPADQEMIGVDGADAARAWGRKFARDNAYAWGVSDTIVSSVIGSGIKTQSCLETQDGEDVELINEVRDETFASWCKVADINGQLSFFEMMALAQREMVEAGEVFVRKIAVPLDFRGIKRPVPLALELIEADRIATDRDTWQFRGTDGRRVVRGVELDEFSTPVAYWVYPHHPADNYVGRQEAIRIEADQIIHLYRKERAGQTRGVTWYAPVMQWMRDLNLYLDNEMQAGAIASCFTAFVQTASPMGQTFGAPSTADQTDANGNRYDYLEPGRVLYLNQNESVQMVNPSRPNSGAEPWINLMLRGIAVGTGLSYEIVARDFSQTNYSSNRASQLEDRRRFRRWQDYMIEHLCRPVWREFCAAASMIGKFGFPSMQHVLEDVDRYCPAVYQPPTWEWVDPVAEQQSSEGAINAFQSTYEDELGGKNKNWRHVFYQRAKEEKLLKQLGLVSPTAERAALAAAQEGQAAVSMANVAGKAPEAIEGGTGELATASTLQFKRNRKAIETILAELSAGTTTEAKARVFLSSIGLTTESIDALIADAMDGSGVLELVHECEGDCERELQRSNCGTGDGGFKPGNTCADGGGSPNGLGIKNIKVSEPGLFDVPLSDMEFPGGFGQEVAKLESNLGKPVIAVETTTGFRLIDGWGRVSGMKNAGVDEVEVILVTEDDLKDRSVSGDDEEWNESMYEKYTNYKYPGTTN